MNAGKWITAAAVVVAVLMLMLPPACALNVDTIVIGCSTNRHDGAIGGYACNLYIQGTGITSAKVTNTTTGVDWSLSLRPNGTWGVMLMYGDLPTFQAQHPNPSAYHVYINEIAPNVYEDEVLLGYAVTPPTDYVHIAAPFQGEMDVPIDPVYSWDNIEDLGWAYGVTVRDVLTQSVYENVPDFDLTETSWQPGALDYGAYHEFLADIYTITGGAPLMLTTLDGDGFGYYGLNYESNQVNFTTEAIPEPVSVMLIGTATLTALGVRRRRKLC